MLELFDEVDGSASSVRNVIGDVLGLCGVKPVRISVVVGPEGLTGAQRDKIHYDMRRFGAIAK